ncbi:MAG: preprotein translocase subunit SecA, partial [Solirubrobacteraceae bacterium]
RVKLIGVFEPELELDSDAELAERVDVLRERARDGEKLDDLLPECFAIVREAGKRALGMRHFDVQMIGGMALHDGCISEMKTGEGKTLSATLAVVLNSLAPAEGSAGDGDGGAEADGTGPSGNGVVAGSAPRRAHSCVHVVTVNDYLARRDAEWMAPIYEMLGLRVGVIQNMQPFEGKHEAYACDVVYGTNSEFGFDYLRDNMAKDLHEKVQTGHHFAIVDEVDNILIDEARTPLIISGAPEQATDLYLQFARLAPRMQAGETPEGMDPRQKKAFVADFDYEFDEKHKTVAITEQGVAKAERFLGIDHLYRAENGHLVNHLIQALRAESLYKRDVDYSVIDGEVKIIDEFTGRILEGRRWSEGLHQAIEAKEGVALQEENQTLATITYQNYFRLYDKLSGMTGTALTEATEFMKIYNLAVVQIPTNMPMVREDRNDQVYKTKDGKWHAVVEEIAARNEAGQPVLVGTISVEVSEVLSEHLKVRGIKHSVLNAKPEHAAREADVVAEAGRPGAVTIATNMAGRGVDIKLGGNAEHLTELELAKEGVQPGDDGYAERFATALPALEQRVAADRDRVTAAGGLYICGTERHESRRIDNQLRGRAGRQGDPGESRFFLSAEDDLVRLFAGDRIYKILDRLGGVDDEGHEEPIEAGMLSKQIEKAQKKVEEQNFLLRKRVLEYDDVINEQRRVIYAYRDSILEGKDMGDEAREQVVSVIERTIGEHTASESVEDWDLDSLTRALSQFFGPDVDLGEVNLASVDSNAFADRIVETAMTRYDAREAALEGIEPGLMRRLERYLMLEIMDERWREHLFDMDYLREGIHLRGFAQIDPLVNEGFEMFGELMNNVWTDFTRWIYNAQVDVDGAGPVGGQGAAAPAFAAAGSSTQPARVSYSGGSSVMGAGALAAAAAAAADAGQTGYGVGEDGEGAGQDVATVVQQRVVDTEHQVGRNDPCWCGSGKKFKRCHGA